MRSDTRSWNLWGKEFSSPIMLASGTAGFGLELMERNSLAGVALVVSKATTLEPREGNPPPRIVETRFGLLNSVGLANPGVHAVMEETLPAAAELPCPLMVNIAGEKEEEFAEVVRILDNSPVPLGYEINVSCPNVAAGGVAFGASPETVMRISGMVRKVTGRPFSVKLTPNEGSLKESALAAQEGGADAVTVSNTYLGMRIDWRTGQAYLHRRIGGYSSPAILPMTVARVHSVSSVVSLPVLASGGVSCPEDVLELLSAGASMVQVGTLVMRRPDAPAILLAGITELLGKELP